MVAIIGGNGLGLNESSLGSLGRFGAGQTGSAAQGQSGERAYVDASNGNLVLQDADGLLAGLGPDVTSLRTYNSQGVTNFTNNDGWTNGHYKSVVNIGGGVLRRTESDGSTTDYAWNATSLSYVETFSPSGAVDTIKTNTDGTFTWTSGATGGTEIYQGSGSGLILSAKDASGNALTFSYTGNLLTGVRTASGESIAYTYSGNNLTEMRTTGTTGQMLSKVTYTYDSSNRLSSVNVTLNPLSQAQVTSAETLTSYLTTYTYDGTSNRVASFTQSDGTTMSFTYALVNGAYRVATVTDGNGAITQFAYNTTANTTTVTDPYGASSVYTYDSKGQLTQIRTGVTAGNSLGLSQANYAYNSLGEVTSIKDGQGRTITMVYDSKGNQTSQVDSAGDTVSRTYNAMNQLLTETTYALPSTGGVAAAQPMTTRYVYAAGNATLLRYALSAEGGVTEYRYNAQGLRTSSISYKSGSYPVSGLALTAVPTEAQVQTWASSQDLTQTQRTDFVYDFRGQLQTSTSFGSVDVSGNGISTTASATTYIYNQRGEQLQTTTPDGKGISQSVYDGLGRVVSTVAKSLDGTLSTTTITQYDEAHGKVTLTLANGLSTSSTFDKTGRLISVVQSSGGPSLGTTSYEYDKDGRLLMTTDPTGRHAWAIYDAAGRKVGDIDGAGGLTEFVYNASNQVTQTIRYAKPVSTTALVDGSGKATTSLSGTATLNTIRPTSDSADQKNWNLYDSAGRLAWQVDGMGTVTQTTYDGASRVMAVTQLATQVETWKLGNGIGVTLYAGNAPANLLTKPESGFESWTPLISGTGTTPVVTSNTGAAPDGTLTADTVTFDVGSDTTSSAYSLLYSTTSALIPGNRYTGSLWIKGAVGQKLVMRGVGSTYQIITCTGSWQQVSDTAAAVSSSRNLQFGLNQGISGIPNTTATVQVWRGRMEEVAAPLPNLLTKPESGFESWTTMASGTGTAPVVTSNTGAAPDGTLTADTVTFNVGSGTISSDFSLLYSTASALIPGNQYTGSMWIKGTAGQQLIMRGAGNGGYVLITCTGSWQQVSKTEAAASASSNLQFGLRQGVPGILNTTATVQVWRGRMEEATAPETTPYTGVQSQALVSVATASTDRTATSIYNKEGLLRASVDGEGYLKEYQYNAAGQLVQTIAYSNPITGFTGAASIAAKVAAARSSNALTGLLPTVNAVKDISTFTFYNAKGQVIGQVDGQGYLTEMTYDTNGRVLQTKRYANKAVGTVSASSTLTSLRPAANTEDQTTSSTWDDLGRLKTQTNAEGTVTQYTYDVLGRVLSSTTALNTTDQRVGLVQYDVQGRVTAELSGVGASKLTGNATTDASIWTQYATKYAYDAAGRRISQTDALGHKTVLFYDDAGRITHTVKANGEVSETEYDALGRVKSTTQYGNQITGESSAALLGGVLSSAANQGAVKALMVAKYGTTDTTLSGAQAVRIWHRQGTNSSISRTVGTFQAGDVITATAWFKAPVGTKGQIYLGNSAVPSDLKYIYADGNGEWQKISVTVTATQAGTFVVALYGNRDYTTDNNQSVIYDKVAVSSIQKGVVLQDGFEGDLSGWYTAGQADLLTSETATTYTGNSAARVWHRQGTNSSVGRTAGTFQAGDVVTASAWFKAPVGTKGQIWLGNGASTTDRKYVNVDGNGEWQKISVTVTVTQAGTFGINLYGNRDFTTDNNQSVIYDDVVVNSVQQGVVLQNGFETGLSGWGIGGQVDVLTAATATTYTGNSAVRVWHRQGTNSAISRTAGTFQAGDVVTATAWFKAPVGTKGQIYLGNSAVPSDLKYIYVDGNGEWQKISVTVTATQAGTFAVAVYGNRDYTTDNAQSVIYDDVSVNSVQQGVVVSNGFESGLSGWYISGQADVLSASTGMVPEQNSTTTMSYNGAGLLTRSIQDALVAGDGLGGTASWSYNAFREVMSSTQSISATKSVTGTRTYDRRGLQTDSLSDQGGLNLATHTVYDAFGRVTESRDGNGNTTKMTYDQWGRVVTVTDPFLKNRVTTYDAFGRVLTQTDARGFATSYAYSTVNRKVTMTTAEGVVVETLRTRNGQTLSVKDGNGNTTSYKYDQEGRLLETDLPAGLPGLGFIKNLYDKVGNLSQTTDNSGNGVAYAYDAVNRLLTRTVDPGAGKLNLVTSYAYDLTLPRTTVTDPAGVVTRIDYDLKGRVATQTVDPAGLNLQTVYSYDQQGQALTVTTGKTATSAGVKTQHVYDNLGRRTYSVDAEGGVTQFKYDANGNLVDRISYAKRIAVSSWVAGTNPPVVADALHDQQVRMVYDANNRAIYTLSSTGNGSLVSVVASTFDANGNEVKRVAYADTLAAPASTATAAALKTAADALVAAQTTTPNASNATIRRVYDKDNRLTWSVNGAGAVTQQVFDGNGNLIKQVAYAKTISATADPSTVIATNGMDRVALMAYDAAGRVRFTVDALGSVTEAMYDGSGNVVKRVAYANRTTAPTSASAALNASTFVPSANATSDRVTRAIYDAAGRQVYGINAQGAVVKSIYNSNGQVIGTTAYSTPLSVATLTALPIVATPANLTPATSADDRTTILAYDAAGRQIYNVDALGYVTENTYDALGQVTATTLHAGPVTGLSIGASAATIAGRIIRTLTVPSGSWINEGKWVTAVPGDVFYVQAVAKTLGMTSGSAHVGIRFDSDTQTGIGWATVLGDGTPNSVNASGWTYVGAKGIAPLGATKAYLYIEAGASNVGAVAQFDKVVYTVGSPVAPAAPADRVNKFVYDASGNLTSSTDALGYTESYTYDGVGNKRTFTNKKGATWTYDYDAAGRLTQETSPQVQVTTLTQNATTGILSAGTTTSVAIVTKLTYDALGNLRTRREADGTASARTTSYQYDALGHQIRTTYPSVGVYNVSDLANLATDGAGASARTETSKTLFTQVFYNSFGEAVINLDVAGKASSKVYDNLGRVTYDIDAMGYVTEYGRTSFGEVSTLTRYATANTTLNANAGTGTAPTLASVTTAKAAVGFATGSRTITTKYDALGRAYEVTQPSAWVNDGMGGAGYDRSAVTRTTYNAFGEVFQSKALATAPNGADGVGATWAVTTNYYDGRGQLSATVDPLGYVTTLSYDGVGNVKQQTEFAKASPGWTPASANPAAVLGSPDRTVTTTYDLMNQKKSEVQVGVKYSTAADGTEITGNLITTFDYDQVGNLTVTTDAKGNQTLTTFDALGRIMSVQSAAQGGATPLTPLTAFKRDAVGNVVIRTDGALTGGSPARNTFTQYDALGHATAVTDALNINRFMSYDAAGHLVKTWQAVTGKDAAGNALIQTLYTAFTYDDLGRQKEIITPATTNVLNAMLTGDTLHDGSAILTQTQALAGSVTMGMTYNAFGEVTGRGSYATGTTPQVQETLEYDNAGRVWRTHGQDGVRIILYDVQGRQTAQITSAGSLDGTGLNLNLATDASASLVDGRGQTGVRRMDSQLDLLGRVVKQTLPLRSDAVSATDRPEVIQTFDRWGNVLTQSDVRSSAWVTQYTYNVRNQVTSQKQPDVVSNGQLNDNSPVTQYFYDALGQQVAVKDARGFVNGQEWDAGGHLVKETHADGGIVSRAYNEFGEQTQITDAMGGVTQYGFDALGRNTTITHKNVGIYTTSADGKSAVGSELQNLVTSMVYDEAGHKVSETVNSGDVDATKRFTTRYTYDLRGNVLTTTDPLGRVKKAAFNIQDRQKAELDALGGLTTWTFDASGQLTGHDWSWVVTDQVWVRQDVDWEWGYDEYGYPAMVPIYTDVYEDVYTKSTSADVFTYDNARQLKNQTTTLADGQKLTRSYSFDAAGQMTKILDVSTTAPVGTAAGTATTKTTTYTYLAGGQHKTETTMVGLATYQNQTLSYDTLGRLSLVEDAVDGIRLEHTYDKVGNKLKAVVDRKVTTTREVQEGYWETTWDEFGYKTREWISTGSHTDTTVQNMTQNLHFAYDKMNRQIMVDGISAVASTITDADGITNDHIAGPVGANGTNGIKLTTTVNGGTPAITYGNQAQGHILTYDKNGNRTSDTTYGTQITASYNVVYNNPIVYKTNGLIDWEPVDGGGGEDLTDWDTDTTHTVTSYGTRTGVGTTFYSFDAMNRLSTVKVGAYDQNGNLLANEAAHVLDQRQYDGASRMVKQGPTGTLPAAYLTAVGSDTDQSGVTSTVNKYDAAGQLTAQHVVNQKTASNNYDATYRYDVTGNMTSYTVVYTGTTTSFHTALTMLYGSYKDTAVTEWISANGQNSSGTVSKTYDAAGMLVEVTDATTPANNRVLTNDASGHVIQKHQGSVISKELIANGEVVSRYSKTVTATDPLWNFDLAYSPVTNSYPAAATGNYPVQSGDTLKGIAQAAYGDSSLWYVIAEANGLSGDQDLRVGQVLTIPNRVGSTHNTSETRAPYDPSKIVGSTTPNLPVPQAPPSSGGGCGGLGMIIMIVVAVVVTIYTAGAAAAAMSAAVSSAGAGTMAVGAAALAGGGAIAGTTAVMGVGTAIAAAAIGGAVGSIASQVVGMAIGAQEEFSWSQVAMSAVGSAASAGVGGMLPQGAKAAEGVKAISWGTAAGKAAVSNAMTQGIEVAVGLQDHFSWTSVAASAVGAGVGKAVGDGMNSALSKSWGDFDWARGVTSGTVSGFAGGMATAAMHGGKIDVIRVATDAFGNALGSGLADEMTPKPSDDWAGGMFKKSMASWIQNSDVSKSFQATLAEGDALLSGLHADLESDSFMRSLDGYTTTGTGGDDLPPVPNAILFPNDGQPLPEPQLTMDPSIQLEDGGGEIQRAPLTPLPSIPGSKDSTSLPSLWKLLPSDPYANTVSQIHVDREGHIMYFAEYSGHKPGVIVHDVSSGEALSDLLDGQISPHLGKWVGKLEDGKSYNIGDQIDPSMFQLYLGKNEQYRDAINLASQRTGVSPAAIASVISAEAASFRGVWNPDSYNPKSGAEGLTQFLSSTWLGEAKNPDTYLNQQARARGFVRENNQILNQQAVLDLRRDPTLSIVAAAEYDFRIFENVSERKRPGGAFLIPTNLTETERARYLYLGHHEGQAGEIQLLLGTIPETRASKILFPTNVPKSQQSTYLTQNGGSSSRAYTSWLWDYTRTHINPVRFTPPGGKK